MTRFKRNIIILTFAIIIYLCLVYFKSCMLTKKVKKIYVLNKDISRGEKINSSDLDCLVVEEGTINLECVDNVENLVAKTDLNKGKIFCKEDTIAQNEYKTLEDNNKEKILIKLDDMEAKSNNKLVKGSIVNIYYTGRTAQLDSLITGKNFKKVKSSSIADGYTTIAFLNNIKIYGVYNKNGEDVKSESTLLNNTSYAIEIEVEQEIAMLVQNLKNYGKFSITIKK